MGEGAKSALNSFPLIIMASPVGVGSLFVNGKSKTCLVLVEERDEGH
jgi:hypothetical protein